MAPDKKTVPIELRVFAGNFKFARQMAKLRQEDVNQLTKLGRAYISDVERLAASVGIDTMGVMAQAIQVPLYCLLDPGFQRTYDFESNVPWVEYKKLIDNSDDVVFERKLFAKNLKESFLATGLKKSEISRITNMDTSFLYLLEKAARGINLENALRLAHFLNKPLSILLMP